MFKDIRLRYFDLLTVLLVIALGIAGIVAIGSATRINSPSGTDFFANKQTIGLIIGFVSMLIVSVIDYRLIGKFFWAIYILNIVLLVAVLFAGVTTNNSTRWIQIGSFTVQPSEFAKLFTIIVMAKLMDMFKERINKPFILLPMLAVLAMPIVFIVLQPDLSTSLVVLGLIAILLYVGGLSYKYIIALLIITIPTSLYGFWYIQQPDQTLLEDYQKTRIMSLIRPEDYDSNVLWQTNNSIQAIGSGQFSGKGLYMGKINQYDYLPEPQTDFIFSIIGEEFGFVGCVTIIVLMFLLITRLLWIAFRSEDRLGRLIATGMATVLGMQTFINIGVATGILPNTGIPLPFVSYGLSALVTNLTGIGIVLNIGMHRKTKNEKRGQPDEYWFGSA